jgi:hypothetical protein
MRRREYLLLLAVYLVGLYLRLAPRLEIDPHLLTFQGDIWYRLCMAQYLQDHWTLPEPDIRYLAYGWVPMWYPPLSPVIFALTGSITGLDIPTISSRLVPFIEAATPLTLYPLAAYLYNRTVAAVAVVTLALTPSFVFWSGISDPQSFTLFLIPLLVLVWARHSVQPMSSRSLALLGAVLALDFLLHLTYFLAVLVLLMVTLALVLNGARRSLLLDWAKVVLISQALTSPWWLFSKLASMPDTFSLWQKNLYWWWVKALVTSSGLYTVERQLEYYGYVPAVLGVLAFFYLAYGRVRKKELPHLILLLWAVPLILEAENEAILKALGKTALTWQTLYKPLEGFRFFPFLAQPLSIGIGVMVHRAMGVMDRLRGAGYILPLVLLAALLFSLQQYNLPLAFQTSGLVPGEYQAALWYRDNSGSDDRIIADYYRAQMFAGVCGGRALLGGMFPLRNLDYPYIKAPGEVQNDLYILYKTPDPEKAAEIAGRYGATHIFYSRNMESYGNLLSYYKPASDYGVEIDKTKFEDPRYFETVYRDGDIEIIRVLPPP